MPVKKENLIGRNFGRLTVIAEAPSKNGRIYWECRCVCNNIKNVGVTELRRGDTTSCGCYNAECARERLSALKTTHGMSRTPIYGVWCNMIARCNPSNKSQLNQKYYVASGIEVCEGWHTFDNFFSDMGASYFEGASIERKDNDKNYSPDNCIWIPVREQPRNTRRTVASFELAQSIRSDRMNGMLLRELSDKYGLKLATISSIVRRKCWTQSDMEHI